MPNCFIATATQFSRLVLICAAAALVETTTHNEQEYICIYSIDIIRLRLIRAMNEFLVSIDVLPYHKSRTK